jgi:hypothetical protein
MGRGGAASVVGNGVIIEPPTNQPLTIPQKQQHSTTGLYKQLAIVKDLLTEYRENPAASAPLRAPIIVNLNQAGLQDDCPYRAAAGGEEAVLLDEEGAEKISEEVGCSLISFWGRALGGRWQFWWGFG